MHQERKIKNSDFMSDAIIGLSDGLTVPFALAAGISGAINNNNIIITAGVAEIVAGSIAMGLGGYLAGQTELHYYQSELNKEYEEVEKYPEAEMQEVKTVFAEYGFDEATQTQLANHLAKDKKKWVDFMMRFELGLSEPHPNRARNSALTIGIAYCLGGALPLLGYFFTTDSKLGLIYSAIITSCCLLIFGYFKSKITGQNPWLGAIKVTAIGLLAAGAAYLIAGLIHV